MKCPAVVSVEYGTLVVRGACSRACVEHIGEHGGVLPEFCPRDHSRTQAVLPTEVATDDSH